MCVEVSDVVEHPADLAGVIEHHNAAGACHRTRCCERIEVERKVPKIEVFGIVAPPNFKGLIAAQNFGGGAAGNDRFELAPILWSAAHLVKEFAEGDFSDLHLEITRLFHVT